MVVLKVDNIEVDKKIIFKQSELQTNKISNSFFAIKNQNKIFKSIRI